MLLKYAWTAGAAVANALKLTAPIMFHPSHTYGLVVFGGSIAGTPKQVTENFKWGR